ncbi:MAG: lipoyl synthase [Defluviitaleaceae bacterium]|nr:lipoyl synthase [Defluviitaleaceae bacterium]MCL2239005.1 lipoyl synthase [Defluviitaleaceae bacterium]
MSRDEFLSLHAPERKPDWLRLRHVENPNQEYVEKILRENNLNTVCREANCPNQGECFSQKTATFIIMGTHCTRSCRFCNIQNGPPKPLDSGEPQRVANAIKSLELKYAVITSVTRDDLPDGGAAHFAKTIAEIRKATPETLIEVLIPDFAGDFAALKTVTDATPDVISHNMETVASLYDIVRPQAGYRRSLEIIHKIKQLNPRIRTKSGIMLGMGETDEEIHAVMRDLREADCAILTIGQYLPPSDRHHRVAEYVTPQKFEAWGVAAREAGFAFVASAPLVRSSFRAGEAGKLLPLNGGIQ